MDTKYPKMQAAAFFPAGAPPFAAAPLDAALTQRINKLVEFASRIGQ
jgi:hypothetical protein